MKRILTIAVAMLAACSAAHAQDGIEFLDADEAPDFRTRFSVSAGGGIGRNFSWEVSEEVRVKESFGSFDRFNTSVSFGYKPVKWLKIAPGYSLFNIYDIKESTGEERWKTRHRAFLNLTASVSAGQWKFSLRERPQVTVRTDSINVMEKTKASFVLRSRVQAEYSFRRVPLTPYALVEMTNTLNTPDTFHGQASSSGPEISYKLKNHISKMRYSVGIKYKLDRHSSFDLNYRIDDGTDYDIHITKNKGYLKSVTRTDFLYHILSIGYSYKF